jgi:uncharacterized protein
MNMTTLKNAADEFLSHRRIAVAGVARDGASAANYVYQRLREAGYEVFPVNPNATEVEGDRCYASVSEIPGGVDGVVIGTAPEASTAVVGDCVAAGVPRVWFHRSFGAGSVSEEAVELARREGLAVIPGACPRMFLDPVDFPHRCMRWVLGVTGNLPEPEAYAPELGVREGSTGTP